MTSSAACDHQAGLVGRQLAEIVIDFGGGFLEDAEGADDGSRHPIEADREVEQRALGLRAPVAIVGDLDRAHAVGLERLAVGDDLAAREVRIWR